MEELVFLAIVFLLFVGLFIPILAISAHQRTKKISAQLHELNLRIEALEARDNRNPSGESVTRTEAVAFAPEKSVVTSAPLNEKIPEPEPEPEPEHVAVIADTQHSPHQQTNGWDDSFASQTPSVVSGLFTSLFRWFMQGNPLAKLGVLLLFIGISFLLRYSVENRLFVFPVELRLVVVALFAIVMLVLGWRLRHKKPLYALIIQGGATGVLVVAH